MHLPRLSRILTTVGLAGAALVPLSCGPGGEADGQLQVLNVNISDGEMEQRRSQWTPPPPNHDTGVMGKYAKLVSSASKGAVTT